MTAFCVCPLFLRQKIIKKPQMRWKRIERRNRPSAQRERWFQRFKFSTPTSFQSATFVRPLFAFVLCFLWQKIIKNHKCDESVSSGVIDQVRSANDDPNALNFLRLHLSNPLPLCDRFLRFSFVFYDKKSSKKHKCDERVSSGVIDQVRSANDDPNALVQINR